MANSMNVNPGAKVARSSNTFLPYEMIEMVALYLPRGALESLSKVSDKCKAAALSAKNVQQMSEAVKQLQALCNLNPSFPQEVSSAIDFYTAFVAHIHDPFFLERYPGHAIDKDQLPNLQQQLTALATQQAVEKFSKLKEACYKEVKDQTTNLEIIEQKYLSLKIDCVAQALNCIILSTVDPEATKHHLLLEASKCGQLELVQFFLSKGPLTEGTIDWVVLSAASRGHLEIVKAAVAHGAISDLAKTVAIQDALQNGHPDIAQFLSQNQP